jgi:O-antigen ligase
MYLTIKGYAETRLSYRLTSWLLAAVCLYSAALTVSRGPIIAVVASLLAASKQFLKAGLLPILLLAGMLLGLLELGIFDQAIRAYSLRAGEETGRLQVWPILIEKFVDSPYTGVGASHAGAWVNSETFRTPHNGFLLFAVASGIVPLGLFAAYCFRSGMAALRAKAEDPNTLFYLPLVVYTVLITCTGNLDFMSPWAVVSLAMPLAAQYAREKDKIAKETYMQPLESEEISKIGYR